ncbi:hypothetical protein LEL_10093 [Akanthomyces lecanii RCEF 1005]|uniref:Uncharacterized protein n=1 Tax=Akanthomyces lecanii RCEF 1005 TaxID=1081108 RepID=A0A168AUN4_CORDF|nr:hypothetical protein LEL_10093 [Akanthomyces lecanii RCEF 1005]
MPLAAIPSTFLLSKEEVSLGEFTTNLAAVHENHRAPNVHGVAPIEKEFEFISQNGHSTETKFGAALSSSISTKLFRKSAYTCSIAADRTKWYLLPDIPTWFKQAMENEKMKVWIQDQAGSSRKIYMITGIQTLLNPRIKVDCSSTKQSDVAMRVPLQLPPNFEIVLPAMDSGGARETSSELEIAAPGEQIFALQYRKVTFKWLRRLSSDPAHISNNTCIWTCVDTPWRGDENQDDDLLASSDEDSSDDERDSAIEVTVEMESTLPGENWVEENTENGYYCISTIM